MALTPNNWQTDAGGLRALFFSAEIKLLQVLKKQLAKGLDGDSWELTRRSGQRAFRNQSKSIIDDLRRTAAKQYRLHLQATYERAVNAAGLDLHKVLGSPVVNISPARSRRLQMVLDELDGRYDNHYRQILRSSEDIYQRIIGRAIAESQASSITLRESVQRSLTEFAGMGIRGFTDGAGRAWGMSEYAEMATRTGMSNAALAGYADTALANGHDLVLITDHSDECPLCAPWENKVLSLTGLLEDHPDCDGTMDEARAAGLFHPNCLHSFAIYIPGLTRRGGGDRQTAAENAAGYQNRQKQRYMERQARAWKRKQAVALDPFEERKCKAHVDRWQEKLRELTAESGLPRRYGREGGRVTLSDASHALLRQTREASSQWQRYGERLGGNAPATLKEFITLKQEGGIEWKRLQWDYRFMGTHAATSASELLPNHQKAFGIMEKLSGYSLNMEHAAGRNKAIVFQSALGYNIHNASDLEKQIRNALPVFKAVATGDKGYGAQYRLKALIRGPEGTQPVDIGWIFDENSPYPRMVNAIVDAKSKRP